MKRVFFILMVLISGICFGQNFYSGVSSINGQMIKFETKLTITDSLIVINSDNVDYTYIVENNIQHYYQADYYGYKFNFTIAEVKGKSFGFAYTHVITMISVPASDASPPISYFARKED